MTEKSATKKHLSAEDFIRAWQTSESVDEVCEKTGMRPSTATNRARTYKKKGVGLKTMPRKKPRGLDYLKLHELATNWGEGGSTNPDGEEPGTDSATTEATA